MTAEEQTILHYAQRYAKALFAAHPVPGHGFDHSQRVMQLARAIATAEQADVFLCLLAALLHDIGRTQESAKVNYTHHELSYVMCQKLFKTDLVFARLSKSQKLNILYSIRYHWNNAADKYFEAVVLRDADKLDGLGRIGLRRIVAFAGSDHRYLNNDLRFAYGNFYWIKTKTAQAIAKKNKVLQPIDVFFTKFLRSKIKPVSL